MIINYDGAFESSNSELMMIIAVSVNASASASSLNIIVTLSDSMQLPKTAIGVHTQVRSSTWRRFTRATWELRQGGPRCIWRV